MSASELFLETLNQLNFPKAHKYKCSDFDSIVLIPELNSFIQSLSLLNEENVLSKEELEEYAAIPTDEMQHLENLALSENSFFEEPSEEEELKELKFLQKHLSSIEACNESIQRQKKKLKLHHNHLLAEKEHHQKVLIDAKKIYDEYNIQKVPRAEDKFVSAMLTTSQVIGELQSSINESDVSSYLTPSSSCRSVENYFEQERQLLKCADDFLHKSLELTEDPTQFTVKLPGLSEAEMLKEVCFLRKILKLIRTDEINALSQRKKNSKVVQFYTNFEESHYPHVFEISSVQLQNKLEAENNQYQQLIEKENILKLCLSNTINEHIDVQCSKIGTACAKEVLQSFSNYLGKIQAPLEQLISQRSRLELVLLYLDSYKIKLEDIKNLVSTTSTFIEKEKSEYHSRKCQYEKELEKPIAKKSEYLSYNSVFLQAYEMLCNEEQPDLTFISMNDLIEKAQKLHDEKILIEKVLSKKLNILILLENDKAVMKKLIFKGKKFFDLLQKDYNFNKVYNQVRVKKEAIMLSLKEFNGYKNKKQKILDESWNLRLARKLFVFALTNEEVFKEWLENIKERCEFLSE